MLLATTVAVLLLGVLGSSEFLPAAEPASRRGSGEGCGAWAFIPTSNMTVPRFGHTATLLPNGKVLITGGAMYPPASPERIWASAELYDPATGAFRPTGSMMSRRFRHTATLLPDGTVLIAGGTSATAPNGLASGVMRTAELYHPTSETFTPVSNMTAERALHTATLLPSGEVLIAGGAGYWAGGGVAATRWHTAELYDAVSRRFRPTGNLRGSRLAHTDALLPDGTVLIAGGEGYDDAAILSVERYDPRAGTFSDAGAVPGQAYSDGPAIVSLLPNGQVLMVLEGWGRAPTTAVRLYDSRTLQFTRTGSLHAPHLWYTATLLPTGRVLVISGSSGSQTAGAEVYDPNTGEFVPKEIVEPRVLHTATLLADGSVLIAGGSRGGYSGETLASAERYVPEVLVAAPLLYSFGTDTGNAGAILHADTHELVSASKPARAGEVLEVYGTGLSNGSVIPPQVSIGGRSTELLYFGQAPAFAELNQINVRVPNGVAGPVVPVRLIYLGRPSNEVTIHVR